MKIWVLLLIVLLLIVLATREGFDSTQTGNTTGGSSVSALGPNSGGIKEPGEGKQVYGPQFVGGMSPEGPQRAMDTTAGKIYPQLLGGGIDKPSTRIEGVGVVAPSKSWQLDDSLPSPKCTGSDESARYFPYSRCPGDRDVVPDPYRVGQSFSAANYSSRREPTPFLTDFSAFQK